MNEEKTSFSQTILGTEVKFPTDLVGISAYFFELETIFFAKYPFGFGFYDRISFNNVDVVGTNGITGLMRIWGVPLFLYLILRERRKSL